MNTPITVGITVNAPLKTVWDAWNNPQHIPHWAFADDSWGAKDVENDLKTGGKFKTHMFDKKSGEGFDFGGIYTNIEEHKLIEYTMDNGRTVKIAFEQTPEGVKIIQTFDPEQENPEEMQRAGWQAILNSFKKYTEGL